MLHMLPLQMEHDTQTYECVYFFALATHPAQQGKGMMSALISCAFAQCKEKNIDAIALLVQNEALFAFYEKQGFVKSFFVSDHLAQAQPLPQGFALRRIETKDFTAVQRVYHHATQGMLRGRRNAQDFALQLQSYGAESWGLVDAQGTLQAYSMGGSAQKTQYQAVECMGVQHEMAHMLMAALAQAQALPCARWKSAPTAQNCVPQGCLAVLCPQMHLPQHVFLNLQYND